MIPEGKVDAPSATKTPIAKALISAALTAAVLYICYLLLIQILPATNAGPCVGKYGPISIIILLVLVLPWTAVPIALAAALLGGIVFCMMTIWQGQFTGLSSMRIRAPLILSASFLAGFAPNYLVSQSCTDPDVLFRSLISGIFTLTGGVMWCVLAHRRKSPAGGTDND